MKIRSVVTGLVVLALAPWAAMAASQSGCPHGKCQHGGGGYHAQQGDKHGRDWMKEHGNLFLDYVEELGLTDKQVVKLNKLRVEARRKKIEFKHDMWGVKAELRELAHEEKPNRKKTEKKADEIGKLKAKMIKLRISVLHDAKELLTKDQKAKLQKILGRQLYHQGEYGHHGGGASKKK